MARFARLEKASCCGMHSEGNPSGPFVLSLQGLGADENKVRFSPYDCSGRGPVWDRGCFVVGQI